jgi:2-oxo-4-hydroxy-4-carboxy--5-ureidoimidazoline (OHCU) decarboxylase
MELDVVGYHPKLNKIMHYEPSIDALRWPAREARNTKKFRLARKYMFTEVVPWLHQATEVEQIAVFYDHPKGRDTIAGGKLISIDELVAEIRKEVTKCGR